MNKVVRRIRFKTYTLYAVDKYINNEYNFVLSVDASSLKSAREFAKPRILQLNRSYPAHRYEFRWEEDNV